MYCSFISVFLLKSVNKSKFFFYKKNFNHWIFLLIIYKKLNLNAHIPKNKDNSMLPLVTNENKPISKK